MVWGTFGTVHIISLIAAVLMGVGLHFGLKKASRKIQIIVLGVLSFSGIAAIIYNLFMWNSPLEYLPFHLCSLSAMILPITVFTKNKVMGNLLLLWSFGSIMAVVLNHAAANFEIPGWTFFFFYFPHVMECIIPILLFTLGIIKLDYRCTVSTIVITMVVYTAIYPVNLLLNNYFTTNNIVDYAGNLIQVNYMYSIVPDNPLLQILHNILPYEYWYMYLFVPVIAVYLGAIYGGASLVSKLKNRTK